MSWFLNCQVRALCGANASFDVILAKDRFWLSIVGVPINERQTKMLALQVDEFLNDFKGNLTTAEWAGMAKCSSDTTPQDINSLIGHKALAGNSEGGRNATDRLIAE